MEVVSHTSSVTKSVRLSMTTVRAQTPKVRTGWGSRRRTPSVQRPLRDLRPSVRVEGGDSLVVLWGPRPSCPMDERRRG